VDLQCPETGLGTAFTWHNSSSLAVSERFEDRFEPVNERQCSQDPACLYAHDPAAGRHGVSADLYPGAAAGTAYLPEIQQLFG